MTPAARLSAAVEVLADIDIRHRPAADALRDWGIAHRFAGSGDRAAIGGLVYDALRRKASTAYLMGDATPRANMLGMLKLAPGLDVDAVAQLCDGSRFAPEPLTDIEASALSDGSLAVQLLPCWGLRWLDAHLRRVFGAEAPRRRSARGPGVA